MNKLKNKFNLFHSNTISKQFLINYSFLFVLLLVIIGFTFIANYLYVNSMYITSEINIERVYKNTLDYDMKKAFELEYLPEGAYLEYIDTHLTVLSSYNSPHKIGYTYSQKDYNEMIFDDPYGFMVYYPKNKEEFLLMYLPPEKNFIDIFIFTGSFFIISLAVAIILYAKVTSIQIIQPINHILAGVKIISEGNYGNKINFHSKNELGVLRDAINQMTGKIQEEISLREKSESNRKRLILDISHDLKTPLTNITGYAQTLASNNDLSYEQKDKYLDIILSNSNRANNLIQDLFELSQMEMEEKILMREEKNLCELLRRILISYIPELETNHMTYSFEIPNIPIYCFVHEQKLERAIGNIITNSIKYSGKNTTFYLEIKISNDKAIIIIQDNGTGIEKAFVPIIFEPFVRADPSRNAKSGGTGLGLAITKKIIEKHKGQISLDSNYSNGCKFIISLPLSKDI
ncbi:MAG: HAMP domain-containing histidine kinase [Marinisporobacter sp.]|jgi:signal transduction histidine kinase|nr:HAMP domain-containing histidine kinase [Marinisporobacter sp.]